jgi:hypothetical protein
MAPPGQAQDEQTVKDACPGWTAWAQEEEGRRRMASQSQPGEASDVASRTRLLKMVSEDQQARTAVTKGGWGSNPIAVNHLLVVDRRNLAVLHEVIAAGGIPTLRRVGRDGMSAFWLLVQHADDDLALQEQVLQALTSESGVSPGDIAMLTDRVRVHQGRPQVYGSQFKLSSQELVPDPIEDEAHVDERRKSVRLAPMADYACVMRVRYKPPAAR